VCGGHVVLSSDSGLRDTTKDEPARACWVRKMMVRVVSGVNFRVAIDSSPSVKEEIVRSASEGFAYCGGCEAEWVMV